MEDLRRNFQPGVCLCAKAVLSKNGKLVSVTATQGKPAYTEDADGNAGTALAQVRGNTQRN